jgi:superfamily II DNA or RNA helicase
MAVAEIDTDTHTHIKITTTYREKPLIEPLPGATFRAGQWRMPLSWASCQALRGVFKKTLEIGPELLTWSKSEYRVRIEPSLALRDQLEPVDQVPYVSSHLRPYQASGVAWMMAARSGILGDEMGSGKTVQSLDFMRVVHELSDGFDEPHRMDSLPALVIVPNSTKYHWERLARRWNTHATPYVIEGTAVKRRKILAQASVDPTALVIVSLEAARTMSRLAPFGSIKLKRCKECDPKRGDELKPAQCEVHPKELNSIMFRSVFLDEAHRIKDTRSKQTRAVWYLMHSPGVNYRWALTGTVIANHPGDLWALAHAVAPEDFPTKTKFIDRYCLTDWNIYGGMDIVGLRPDTKDEFFKIFEPRFRRMLKSVILPFLPEITRDIRTCELTPAMRRTYDELYGSLATRMPDGTLLVAYNDMTKQGKLTQLASSSVEIDKRDPDDISTWKITLKDPSPKLDALEELLDDLDPEKPVVVAAESIQLIHMAAERLDKRGTSYVAITGDVPAYERENALDALRQGAAQVLLFTIKAGGVGLDMSAADTLIFLQQPWSMVERLQTEGRVHRIGSEVHNSVKIIDLVTRDTVEEEQIVRVHEKLERLDEITRDRAARAAAGFSDSSLAAMEEQEIWESSILEPFDPQDPEEPGEEATETPSDVKTSDETRGPSPFLDLMKTEVGNLGTVFTEPHLDGDKVKDNLTGDHIQNVVVSHLYDDGAGGIWEHPGHPDVCDMPECMSPARPHENTSTSPAAGEVIPYQVSASKLRDWMRCRRMWWLTWVRQLSLEDSLTDLRAVGTRVHTALAGWYIPAEEGPVDPRDGIEKAIADDWAKLLKRTGIDEDHDDYEMIKAKWDSSTALERAMVEGYMDWLEETGEDGGLTFVASETELSADVETVDHNGNLLIVHLMGKLDARAFRDVDNVREFIDHKTVGNLSTPLKMIQMDPQMLMYGLLEFLNSEEGEARCDGALYNMLRRVKRTQSAKPPFYAREHVRMNDIQLESFKRWVLAASRDMVQAEALLEEGIDPMDVVYPTPGDDCSWKCDFFPVCPLFNDGSRAEDMISSLYRLDNPWSRYDRLEEEGGKDG